MDHLEQHVNGEARFRIVRVTVLVDISDVLAILEFHLLLESLVLRVVSKTLQLADIAEVLAFAALLVVHRLDGYVFDAIFLEFVSCLIFDPTSWSA